MEDNRKVWTNGDLIPWDQAKVHILSHGFSRGSAAFEVFQVHATNNGPCAFRLDDHLKRLMNTTQLLGMELAQSPEEIKQAVMETVSANKMENGFIKIMAYYGDEAFADLVLDKKLDMSIFAIPADADLGLDISGTISACISTWCKLHPRTVPVDAKVSAHYVNAMLARKDAQKRGFDVGLMLDTHGFLAEGSIEAVFIVKNSVLMTAPLGRVLASISRKTVLDVAKTIGIDIRETGIKKEEVINADEIFTSSTPFKVLPVERIEDRVIQDVPGPVSKKISNTIKTIMSGEDDRFKNWLIPLY